MDPDLIIEHKTNIKQDSDNRDARINDRREKYGAVRPHVASPLPLARFNNSIEQSVVERNEFRRTGMIDQAIQVKDLGL